METLSPLPVVVSLVALIDGLLDAVALRYGVFPIRGPLFRFLWKRLFRIRQRFATLAARFAAGADLSPRPSRPHRADARRHTRDGEAFRLTAWVNPKFGWLCRVASGSIGASAFAWSLRHLLTTDPEMRALLAATPATARLLRPLCWMLGVAMPPSPVAFSAATRVPRPEPARDEPTCRDDTAKPDAVAAIRPIREKQGPPDPPDASCSIAVLRAA